MGLIYFRMFGFNGGLESENMAGRALLHNLTSVTEKDYVYKYPFLEIYMFSVRKIAKKCRKWTLLD